jgi:very-short-patch-repair endonuclease
MSELAVALCVRSGGIARTATLRAGGATASDLADAVRAGALMRPRRGLYAVPPVAPATSTALAHRGLVACVTAARALGLWTLDDGADAEPHVWVDPERHLVRKDDCRCVLHRDHRVTVGDLTTVSVAHCLVQIAWCRGAEAFLCALESALNQGMLSPRGREQIRARLPVDLRWLVDFARADAESGLETLLRYRLHLIGIWCATQVDVPGVGRVDLVIGDCLIVEADGGTHGGRQRHRDLERDAVAMAQGFLTLRFDTAMILHDWITVETAIRAAMARGLHESDLGRRVRSGR